MNNRDFFATIERCRFYRQWEAAHNPPPPVKVEKPAYKRLTYEMKTAILVKYFKIIFASLVALNLTVLMPLYLFDQQIGISYAFSFLPCLLIAASWMLGCWYGWEKDRYTFLAVTLGMSPLRVGMALCWCMFVLDNFAVNQKALFIGAMFNWIILMIIEAVFCLEMDRKEEALNKQV